MKITFLTSLVMVSAVTWGMDNTTNPFLGKHAQAETFMYHQEAKRVRAENESTDMDIDTNVNPIVLNYKDLSKEDKELFARAIKSIPKFDDFKEVVDNAPWLVRVARARTLLGIALSRDCNNITKYLIGKGSQINAQNRYGEPTFWEVETLRGIKFAKSKGADFNLKDDKGNSCLHHFISKFRDYVIAEEEEILGRWRSIGERRNPLGSINYHSCGAMSVGYYQKCEETAPVGIMGYKATDFSDIVKYLIEQQEDVNAKRNDGKTPMDLVVETLREDRDNLDKYKNIRAKVAVYVEQSGGHSEEGLFVDYSPSDELEKFIDLLKERDAKE